MPYVGAVADYWCPAAERNKKIAPDEGRRSSLRGTTLHSRRKGGRSALDGALCRVTATARRGLLSFQPRRSGVNFGKIKTWARFQPRRAFSECPFLLLTLSIIALSVTISRFIFKFK